MRFVRTVTTDVRAPLTEVYCIVLDYGRSVGVLVDAAPPTRVVCDCAEGESSYRWTFDLTTSATGTTVHHTVQRLNAPAYSKVLAPVAWELLREKHIREGLARVKAAAELPSLPGPRQPVEAYSTVWSSRSPTPNR